VFDCPWIYELLHDAAFTWRPSWLRSDLFRDLFRGIWLSEQFLYCEKYYFMVFCVLERYICASAAKSTDVSVGFRPPCWSPSGWAPIWRLHINLYKSGEQASLHIWHRKNCCDLNLGESLFIVTFFPSFLRFWTLNGIERFWFLFWSILTSVTLKTSNSRNALGPKACLWKLGFSRWHIKIHWCTFNAASPQRYI